MQLCVCHCGGINVSARVAQEAFCRCKTVANHRHTTKHVERHKALEKKEKRLAHAPFYFASYNV